MLRLVAIVALAVALAACRPGGAATPAPSPSAAAASGGPDVLPLLISSEITKGPNRFLFSITDRQNKLLASPDVSVHLKFYDVDTAADTVVFESDGTFMWAIDGQSGLYRAAVTFPDAGRWGTLFEARFEDGSTESVRADYDVRESGTTPIVGGQAPSIETPTVADVGGDLKQLTTDPEPDPRFYETSIADALAAGTPFVVAFATPAFCQTRTCGPTLETVKAAAKDYPEIPFINVEPYKMTFKDGSLQPELDQNGQLQAAPWTEAWGLQTEPYTFVIAADGSVAAKFEGVIGEGELESALDAL